MLTYPALLDLATQKLHSLGGSEAFLVGRDETADVRVLDPTCSRQHFRIFRRDGRHYVEPLNSLNPTYLDGRPVAKPEPVEHGASLQAGQTRFQFLLRAAGDAMVPRVTNAAPPAPAEQAPSLPAATPSPPRGRLGAILLVAGFGVMVVAGLVTAVVLFRQDGSPAHQQTEEGDANGPIAMRPRPAPPDPRIEIVRPAVERGVGFLRATLKKKAGWNLVTHSWAGEARYGMDGLIGLTLLECGCGPEDPDVLAIAEELRKAGPALRKTYAISATLFFFNRWSEVRRLSAADVTLARSLGLRLCAGQIGLGIWRYDCPVLSAKQEQELLAQLEAGAPPAGAPGGFYSISNSQFAMLALWGARKHGIPVRATLLRAGEHFHRSQFPQDGHWNYDDTQNTTVLWTTATAAGLMALAMDRALREDREFNPHGKAVKGPGKRADVAKAFAFVARSIGRKKGDPGGAKHGYAGTIFQADAWGDLYYLWTIERLGMIYGLPVIEGKDWYDWGYRIILGQQKPDGSWQDKHQPEVDTCFALLFLKRANLAKDLTDKLRELLRLSGIPAGPMPAAPQGKVPRSSDTPGKRST